MSAVLKPSTADPRPSRRGEPTWEVAAYFPTQGRWTEADYFALPDTRMVELRHGCLEFLPVPTRMHQLLARYLFLLLHQYVEKHHLGETHFTGLNVRLEPNEIRVPDICFLGKARLGDPRQVQDLADLMIEVVSPGSENRERDLVHKRTDYARTGVAEYWIVDPETDTITVLTLPAGARGDVHGEFRPSQQATSVLLPGFTVDVAACFAAGRGETP